jgi:hypothetical protein
LATLIDGSEACVPPSDSQAIDMLQVSAPILNHAVVPTGWTLQILEQLAQRLLTDPAIVASQHPGVTRNRVRMLLPDYLKSQDEHVLRWLDAAHLLAPPVTPTEPFRHPRKICCATTTELIRRLVAMLYADSR